MIRDADLLFGLFALHCEYVAVDQILRGIGLCRSMPTLSLERLLVDEQALSAERVTEVRGLVEAELARHGQDAARALSAVPLDPEVLDLILAQRDVSAHDGPKASPVAIVLARPDGGRFRLGAEIGRGGLGQVVEAFDRDLKRDVAVKLVIANLSPQLAARFVREAEITARLEHPNVVPVHDFGEMKGPDGRTGLYFSMKRVRGRDLKAVLREIAAGTETGYSRFRLLRVFQDVCLGVAFAHSKGVIHRDLKPSNVMIGDFGETLIVDWGLARDSGRGAAVAGPADPVALSDAELTMEGSVIGTPAYMPPEQARGALHEVDERSDIFALGGILYEILTFRPPHQGATAEDVLRSAQETRITPPSTRILEADTAASAAMRAPIAGVPPELDALCMKALAPRREDRFASARALHDEVQLFLDGVKERDRRVAEGRERAASGRRHLAKWLALRDEVNSAEARTRELEERIKPHEPLEAKRPVRDARDEARRLREARVEALAAAQGELAQALAVDPECADSADALCELLAERFLEAEARRDRDEMLLHRRMLEERDRTGRHRARLDAPGTLTLRAFVYDCDCLKAVAREGWEVEIEEDCAIAWRDGRPRPDLAVTGRDLPVPRVRLRPEEARFGHRAGCPRREIDGVEVRIARLAERDLQLQPVEERRLGTTPILRAKVPQGSWRCRLLPREAGLVAPLVPVRIERAGDWTQEVVLHAPAEIPAGFVPVPGGPYIHGGRQAGGAEAGTRRTAHLIVARSPVTCDEYIEFLNALASSRRLGEARRRQPREADARYFKETGGRFTLPGRPDDLAWSGALPVPAVSWRDAVSYCAWRSTRDGRVFRLLHDDEWEKSARGVDGRLFPWGDAEETTFSNTVATRADGARLALPGSFPADESPYGIFDLAGNIETWCWNASEEPWRSWRNCRGGSWVNLQNGGSGGARHGDVPDHTARNIGFRLCIAVDGESR